MLPFTAVAARESWRVGSPSRLAENNLMHSVRPRVLWDRREDIYTRYADVDWFVRCVCGLSHRWTCSHRVSPYSHFELITNSTVRAAGCESPGYRTKGTFVWTKKKDPMNTVFLSSTLVWYMMKCMNSDNMYMLDIDLFTFLCVNWEKICAHAKGSSIWRGSSLEDPLMLCEKDLFLVQPKPTREDESCK
jgi:hypothetical protein